jgi:glycosyltransferase involved in cell wall biosynthesis
MKIGIDLRCLNYAKFTGINSYCIHILDSILNSEVKSPNKIEIIGIGLKKHRLTELQNEFIFFKGLFSSFRTLEEYYKFDLNNTKMLDIINVGQIYLKQSLDFDNIEYFDLIVQPQPRLIKLHPKTKLVSFYHDCYNLMDGDLGLKKILNNPKTWRLISERCSHVITNSRSTSADLIKFLGTEVSKIKLIYPGIPCIDELRFAKTILTKKSDSDFNTQTSLALDLVNNHQNFILAISGIEPRKNWINLILAFKHLQIKHNYSKKLVLSGTIVDKNYYKLLLDLIKKHDIKNIEWVIEPSEGVKKYLISNCEFLVYPSFYEGFGFPILEAQKYNKNTLTSKNSSLVEINTNSPYINPNNYISIANGILILDNDYTPNDIGFYDWKELESFFDMLLSSKCF